MANENDTLETLLSRLLTVQSKLEEEANALDSLIKIAYHYADNENADLRSLLDAFKNKVDAIKNAVQAIE